MNYNYLCVFDYETSSNKPSKAQVLQIGAAIVDPHSLEIIDEFNSLAKYEDWSKVEPKALKVNNITKEMLDEAPIIDVVWKQFMIFLKKYNKKNKWDNVIPCGHNIMGYDMPITNRYAKRFGDWSKTDERNNFFHPFLFIDTVTLFFSWFENDPEVKSYSQVNIAKYFGISEEELALAHTAIADVKVNYKTAIRLIKFQRELLKRNKSKIKGAFA